jgi:hypothetical protein
MTQPPTTDETAVQPESPAGAGRIDAGPVLAETARSLARHAGRLPALAWPALAVALAVPLLQRFALPPADWAQALGLLGIPFDLMLGTAWVRLLLLGRAHARVPAFGWGRGETDFLINALIFAAAIVGALVLLVLVVSNLPIPQDVGRILIAAGGWLVLTLLTPLALKVPARAAGRTPAPRAWQARPANVPNAAICWLVFLALAAGLSRAAAVLPQPSDPAAGAGAAVAGLLASLAVEYVLFLTVLALMAAMARRLANWPKPE